MPSARKVKWAQLRVGVMALAAMLLLAVLIYLLTGNKNLFATKATLYTYMDDSAALAVGAPVRLNGIIKGNVSAVELSGQNVPGRIVRVNLSVDAAALKNIPVDSEATISAENVLGTKYINIKKGTKAQTIRDGGEVRSADVSEFEDVVRSGYDVMVTARALLKRIDGVVDAMEGGKGTIGKLLVDDQLYKNLNATVAETQKVAAAISSGQGTVGRLLYDDALYTDIRTEVRRLDEILTSVQQGRGTAGRLINDPGLYDDARKTMAELRRLSEDLNAGKGTAGKFLKDEGLHHQIQSTVAKLENTLDKINAGQGTLGQLLVNPSLYESLNGTSLEMQGLMKDFRANPKKFLRIKLAIF
jgi:phospholipid/cholesterol/gamma-HCH transport system substrate-binding protein